MMIPWFLKFHIRRKFPLITISRQDQPGAILVPPLTSTAASPVAITAAATAASLPTTTVSAAAPTTAATVTAISATLRTFLARPGLADLQFTVA
jgi:hypothetical protein